MILKTGYLAIALMSGLALTACSNTAVDVQKDAGENADKTAASEEAVRMPSVPSVPSEQPTASPAPETAASVSPDGEPGVNQQGAATLEFHKRIQAYMKLHNEAEKNVPSLKRTDDAEEISGREKLLAGAIQTLRATARIGDIFAPEYQPYFIKIVHDDFFGRSVVDRKAIIEELPKNMTVDVNTVYPTSLPLATFPAVLLRKLPDLPPELEYRIVGRSLIMRDVKANLIVDILRDVVPTIPS